MFLTYYVGEVVIILRKF